jgi:succinate dehydrogenase hydrophobic anchor subunit
VSETEVAHRKPSVLRRVIAVLFVAIGIAYAALTVFGVWNPRHYVILLTYFDNPLAGVVVVLFCALVAFWCGFPIRNTAIDRRKSLARTTLVILVMISLFGLGFTYAFGIWRYRPTIVSVSASGNRAVAYVSVLKDTEIRIYAGSGLARRDVGSVGVPCGLFSNISATWVGDNEVKISTAFNNYDVRLDPKTGTPLVHFGVTCTS